jgi:hypothetical protein
VIVQRGYYVTWRKYIDSEVFLDEGLWKLWSLCMKKANWEANSVKMEGVVQPVKLKPGQFITGRYELHGAYHQWRKGYKKRKPAPYTLWRRLKTLERMQFLSIKSTNKFSIITMANWPKEQTQKQKVSNSVSNRRSSDEHRETLSNHSKEGGKPPPVEKEIIKDKADSRSCKECHRPFIPTKDWHTVCAGCYEPRGRTGARPELLNKKCQGCGLEASNVIDGFCPFCEDEVPIQ